jgi:hypothetical protein
MRKRSASAVPDGEDATMADTHTGHCFCGAVEFEATGDPVVMAYCHCTDCQAWMGAPVSGFTMWSPRKVRVSWGEEHIRAYNKTENNFRKFCNLCGSPVVCDTPYGLVELFAALMPDFAFAPTMHVYYAERMIPMKDGLPKFKDVPVEAGGSGETLPE